MLRGIKKGGTFLLNTIMSKDDVIKELPDKMKFDLAKNDINFYVINATEIAEKLGLGTRTNTIMQAAFFKLANVISYDTAITEMKDAIKKSYGKKGDDVVKMNNAAVDSGADGIVKVEIPAEWKNISVGKSAKSDVPEFISRIVEPINRLEGDLLPVSAFVDMADGTLPAVQVLMKSVVLL
jgi:pyruvate-ferredoxin/flavodoxin oxidoreductase